MQIAKLFKAIIEVHANGKIGSTESIISLIQLGINKNTVVAFLIKSQYQIECIHAIGSLLDNGWIPEFNSIYEDLNVNDDIYNSIDNDNNIF
jgi:phosphotransferase system HPr-like phosphotransfer protein